MLVFTLECQIAPFYYDSLIYLFVTDYISKTTNFHHENKLNSSTICQKFHAECHPIADLPTEALETQLKTVRYFPVAFLASSYLGHDTCTYTRTRSLSQERMSPSPPKAARRMSFRPCFVLPVVCFHRNSTGGFTLYVWYFGMNTWKINEHGIQLIFMYWWECAVNSIMAPVWKRPNSFSQCGIKVCKSEA
jgi:hypothetical protein